MEPAPVKLSLGLAAFSVVVLPLVVFVYTGLYFIDLSGLLSIFAPLATGIDVFLAISFLLLAWGNVYLLRAILKRLPKRADGMKTMQNLWKALAIFASALTVFSPLYSVFPGSVGICTAWSAAFFAEWIVGLILYVSLARFGFRGKNWLLLGIGLSLAVGLLADFNGLRGVQTAVDNSLEEMADVSGEGGSPENSIAEMLGISQSEFDTLDDESLADLQEVSAGFVLVVASGFLGLVVLHFAAWGCAYVLIALYFSKRNGSRPGKRRWEKMKDMKIC